MHTGRPTDGDNNRSCWPQTPRRSGRSPLRQGSHKEWHVCRLPWEWGSRVGGSIQGQLHGQCPWWSLLASLQPVSGDCSASCTLAGVGLGAPHPLSLVRACLLKAFLHSAPGIFSPRTLLVSSRKAPMTAQALFLLWVPWPTMSMKNKDGLRLASCPGRNPKTFVQRGHPGEERHVTPHLASMQAACRSFV